MSAERAEDYFEFLAKLGLTKHYGSQDATRELVRASSPGLDRSDRRSWFWGYRW